MYRRVLLAYDGSREGRTALREGTMLARRCGATIFLLCVVAESSGARIGEAAHAGAMSRIEDAYKDLFDEALEGLKRMGFDVSGRLVRGEPVQAIASQAAAIKADIVVVGHRRKGIIERWWSGSTGSYLMDRVGCSLLIAQNPISDEEFYSYIGVEPLTTPP